MDLKPVEKPTFQQIRKHTQTLEGQPITRQLLAEKTGLTYSQVYMLDIGAHLSETSSNKVLRAFHELSGCTLTVHDIKRKGYH
jgi:hypothetical protein